jgi:hypothetical protein
MGRFPVRTAAVSAFSLSRPSRAATFAPAESSASTLCASPRAAASMSGVRLVSASARSGLAPAVSKRSTSVTCPMMTASISADCVPS